MLRKNDIRRSHADRVQVAFANQDCRVRKLQGPTDTVANFVANMPNPAMPNPASCAGALWAEFVYYATSALVLKSCDFRASAANQRKKNDAHLYKGIRLQGLSMVLFRPFGLTYVFG